MFTHNLLNDLVYFFVKLLFKRRVARIKFMIPIYGTLAIPRVWPESNTTHLAGNDGTIKFFRVLCFEFLLPDGSCFICYIVFVQLIMFHDHDLHGLVVSLNFGVYILLSIISQPLSCLTNIIQTKMVIFTVLSKYRWQDNKQRVNFHFYKRKGL